MKKDKLPNLPPIEKLVKALDVGDLNEESLHDSQSHEVAQRDICPILKEWLHYEYTRLPKLADEDKNAEIVRIGSRIVCEYYLYKKGGRCLATDDSNQHCIYK